MSTAEATAPEAPQIPADESMTWLEKLVRMWGLTYLGHDAMMLDKINQQNKRVLDLADATRMGTIGKQSGTSPATGDDMGVSLGNEHKEYHYHYGVAQQANSTTTGGSALGTAAKWAAVAAALLGTGGASAALTAYLLKPSQNTTNQVTFDPSQWQLEVSETEPK